MPLAALTHVRIDQGVAWVDSTNTKVIEIVLDHVAGGWSPEEIHRQHPHLSLSQIHAALAYYFDHQQALDDEIARRAAIAERLQDGSRANPVQQRLAALKTARGR